jgi:hypothetical protein
MKNFKGVALVWALLPVCAIFYSPSKGNKDGPVSKHTSITKYTPHFSTTPGTSIIQLATAETAISFERPATKSTLLVAAPIRKVQYYKPIVAMNNSPPVELI